MASRPTLLDLTGASDASLNSSASATRPLRSPRVHVAGEVPPALSPLDAFAAQSRLLAKQLEDSANTGRRMSRLPPLTTESPLIVQGRSDYFRSLSSASQSPVDLDENRQILEEQEHGMGWRTIEGSMERPQSTHPHLSQVLSDEDDDSEPVPPLPSKDLDRGRLLDRVEQNDGFFDAVFRREQSPASLENVTGRLIEPTPTEEETNMLEPFPLNDHVSVSGPLSPEKENSRPPSRESIGLAPPRYMFPKRSSSIISEPVETADNYNTLSTSLHSQAGRKMSISSGVSGAGLPSPRPQSRTLPRSPSVSSVSSQALPRPSFNFSRPLSRSGTPNNFDPSARHGAMTPNPDLPTRQASSDSQPSFVLADDTAHTPVSMHSEAFTDISAEDGRAGASYIYSKYSLPRGKALQRNSIIFNPNDVGNFHREQVGEISGTPNTGQAPPSPPSRPSSSLSRNADGQLPNESLLARPCMERSKLSNQMSPGGAELSPVPSRPSTGGENGPSVEELRGRTPTLFENTQARLGTAVSTATSDSASTLRPAKSHASTAAEVSTEEHLSKGIKCHEEGSVNESTYHLRLAAKGGSSTGMLLYALACRHGWGMRPNPKEAVQWLRKAANGASVEIAEDEDQSKGGKQVDPTERRARKAQFALSIYELGVSHRNGWGIEQDKALALRCFEIAGNWGDVDALAEAGFCYAQGIGCKKDLKKSAKFYRMAEAKGMSMPGNSWIHKAKYNDDVDDNKATRPRSKSRSRSIFHKKSKEPKESE